MNQKLILSRRIRLQLAKTACVDERTINSAYAGGAVRSISLHQIAKAAAELDVPLPPGGVEALKLNVFDRIGSKKPSYVIEAFVRDDVLREYKKLPPGKPFDKGTVFLCRETKPVIGAFVKVQVITRPMFNKDFAEEVAGCFMGGRVHTVHDVKHVAATLEVTSMPAPEDLEFSEWDVELEFHEQLKHPWAMRSMRRRTTN